VDADLVRTYGMARNARFNARYLPSIFSVDVVHAHGMVRADCTRAR
jgi:hypothetical protein